MDPVVFAQTGPPLITQLGGLFIGVTWVTRMKNILHAAINIAKRLWMGVDIKLARSDGIKGHLRNLCRTHLTGGDRFFQHGLRELLASRCGLCRFGIGRSYAFGLADSGRHKIRA